MNKPPLIRAVKARAPATLEIVWSTGEIHFVDCGYNIIAMPQPDALRADAGQGAAEDGK